MNNEDKVQIKKHYNSRESKPMEERKKGELFNLRCANNAIKYALIMKYVRENDIVLDIGVGKGGDLHKYQMAKIKELYGVDIANRSILDAIERARDNKFSYICRLKTQDAFGELFDLKRKFDIVSSQFTYHYSFLSEKTFMIGLQNISNHLKPGGYFILTTLSKSEILSRKNKGKLKNKYFSIEFKDENSRSIFGNSYYFTLKDCINKCVEYLVDIDELKRVLNDFGFRLIEIIPFGKVINENNGYRRYLNNKIEYINNMSLDEKEVFNLSDLIVFRKDKFNV